MCEYCHQSPNHHPQCPNAPEPKVRGRCKQCGDVLREDYEYVKDNNENKFCSEDCAIEYYGIKSEWWDDEEEV